MINLAKPVPAVTVVACLVLVPNAVGIGARAFPKLFRYVSSWIYPSARIELLSILGVVLAFAFVFYVFLTSRSRARSGVWARGPLRDTRRRYLPPLEILLLQLGNFSFLVFALIVLVLAVELLFSALRGAVDSPRMVNHNLGLSLALALLGTALALRPSALGARSFATLVRAWLPWATLCSIALAAFGLIDALGGSGLLRIHLAASVLPPEALGLVYASLLICLVLGRLLARADAASPAPGLGPRRVRLVSGLGLAATATIGLSALLLHAAFLTLFAHLGDR